MNGLNHEFLGYAASPECAHAIICQTGFFYMTVSIAYAFSFINKLLTSPVIGLRVKNHLFFIFLWLMAGSFLAYGSAYHKVQAGVLMIITGLSIFVLYFQNFLSILITCLGADSFNTIDTENKKLMYILTTIKKNNLNVKHGLESILINEQILWLLILYRALISLRALFAFI